MSLDDVFCVASFHIHLIADFSLLTGVTLPASRETASCNNVIPQDRVSVCFPKRNPHR